MSSPERLEWEVEQLKRESAELENRIHNLETEMREKDELEKRRLIAGIAFLGSIVLSLLGVIWAYRSTIFIGKQ